MVQKYATQSSDVHPCNLRTQKSVSLVVGLSCGVSRREQNLETCTP